jgi:hypothetical protein
MFVFGTGGTTPYNATKIDPKGRIRISVAGEERLDALKNSAILVHNYETRTLFDITEAKIMESVVASTICTDTNHVAILEGKQPIRDKKPKTIVFTSSQEIFLEEIKNTFRDDFSFGAMRHTSRSTYLLAFATLVVDDSSIFQEKMKEAIPHPLTGIDKRLQIYSFLDEIDGFMPYLGGIPELPLLLLVIESRESFDWIDNGTVPKKENDAYSITLLVRDYLLHLYRLDLLDSQLYWLNSRCKNLLETLPKDEPQTIGAREERLKQLLKATRDLEFYYSSYQMVRDFIIREDEPQSPPQGFILEGTISKSLFKERLTILDETLTKLEQSLQRRVTLERLTIEWNSKKQQERTEASFKGISIFIASLFVFEILAAFLSWFYQPLNQPVDFITAIVWTFTIFIPLIYIYVVFADFRKLIDDDSEDSDM